MKVVKKRREFLSLLPLLVAGAFSYPTARFIFFSEDEKGDFSISLKNIKEGITKINSHNLFIYKKNDFIKVYDAHCTHMGCILAYSDDVKLFNCPCHKSRFDIDGKLLRGPAKRDLDTIDFKIKNKTLYIG